MPLRIPLLALSFALVLALAACGSTSTASSATATVAPTATTTVAPPTATSSAGGAATIKMGSVNFTVGNATVKAGQTVMFVDPTPGGIHHLVTGHNGTFAAKAGAPSQFATADGVSFSPGDTTAIVFPTAGTYDITCTIHPLMEATVTVTP
jgi:plastocyanin